MNILRTDVTEWLNRLYPRDWEDHYYKSDRVKLIKDEMDVLGDRYYDAKKNSRYGGESADRLVDQLKEELIKKQKELIGAIENHKKILAEEHSREKAEIAETKRLAHSRDANHISKRSQTIAVISLVVSALVSPTVSYFLSSRHDSDFKEKVEGEVLEHLKPQFQKLESETQALKNEAIQMSQRITEMEKHQKPAFKPKIKANYQKNH